MQSSPAIDLGILDVPGPAVLSGGGGGCGLSYLPCASRKVDHAGGLSGGGADRCGVYCVGNENDIVRVVFTPDYKEE
jgi:hypothetical protein